MIGEIPPADLVFDPTHAVWKVALRLRALTHFSRDLSLPDGLTSRPHHAPRHFGRITWTVLPATGFGFQPQTRRIQPPTLYMPETQNTRTFFVLSNIFKTVLLFLPEIRARTIFPHDHATLPVRPSSQAESLTLIVEIQISEFSQISCTPVFSA